MDKEGFGLMEPWINPAIITILGGVIITLLGFVLSRVSSIDNKVDKKQDKTECEKQAAICQREFSTETFWNNFDKHSHTGLPDGSKVVRLGS
jgi:hypothetical protein